MGCINLRSGHRAIIIWTAPASSPRLKSLRLSWTWSIYKSTNLEFMGVIGKFLRWAMNFTSKSRVPLYTSFPRYSEQMDQVQLRRDFGDVKCATEGRELFLILFRQSRNDQNRHLMHRRNLSPARLRFLARHNRAAKTCNQTLRSRRLAMTTRNYRLSGFADRLLMLFANVEICPCCNFVECLCKRLHFTN